MTPGDSNERWRKRETGERKINLRMCYWADNYRGPLRNHMLQNYLLKTWQMGVLIHGSCALVPCWSRIVSGVLTSWNFQVCLWTTVIASSGRHISEENVRDLQHSLVKDCDRLQLCTAACCSNGWMELIHELRNSKWGIKSPTHPCNVYF